MRDGKETPQSKGGKARAALLSDKKKKSIATNAAIARWHAPAVAKYGRADRPLKIGDVEIPCFVLEDGRRVLATNGLQRGIGLSDGGGRDGSRRLVVLMRSLEKKGIDIRGLADRADEPIWFMPPQGGKLAAGYEATILPDMCAVIIDAHQKAKLGQQRQHLAEQCAMLQHGFATVGIIALVDEATGYQAIRPQDALAKYLEAILRKELAAWSKRFPDEFYENIYKLKSWPWPGMKKNRYSVVAQYTRDLVYQRIAPTLLEELEKKEPKDENGNRKHKLHQWLTEDIGHPMLAQHLHALVMLQRLAIANRHGWTRFVRSVDQVLPKKGETLDFGFEAGE